MKIEERVKTVYVGADGIEFDDRGDALKSLAISKLDELLFECGAGRSIDVDDLAENLWDRRQYLISLLDGAEE